jgi:hypothetical protein
MTNRERWIIYPLLFMSLGYGWKANVIPPNELTCHKLTCDELVARRHAEIGTASARRWAGNRADFGVVTAGQVAIRDNGFTDLELSSTQLGGIIQVHRHERRAPSIPISVVDENGRAQMIGRLVRHPPKGTAAAGTDKSDRKKEEKTSEQTKETSRRPMPAAK